MCEPTTLMIASTVLLGAGQIQAGMAAEAAGDANAKFQRAQAADARERGAADEADFRRQNQAFLSRQAAAFGASGAELNTGSSADILADTAQLGELDALRIRNNAEREAFAFETGAAISKAEGKNARTGAFLSAAGTLLGGAGQTYGKFKTFQADAKKAGTSSSFGAFLRS